MTNHRKGYDMYRIVIAAAAAAPLALAACSSSGTAGTGTANLPGGIGRASHPVTTSSTPDSAGGGNSAAAWCQELKAAGDGILAVGGSSTISPDVYKSKLIALVSDAPADIRPDLETLAQIDEKLADGDQSAESELGDPAVAGKVRHVVTWLSTNCKGIVTGLPTG